MNITCCTHKITSCVHVLLIRVAAFTTPNEVLCVLIVSHVSTSGTVDTSFGVGFHRAREYDTEDFSLLRVERTIPTLHGVPTPSYRTTTDPKGTFTPVKRAIGSLNRVWGAGHHGHILMT